MSVSTPENVNYLNSASNLIFSEKSINNRYLDHSLQENLSQLVDLQKSKKNTEQIKNLINYFENLKKESSKNQLEQPSLTDITQESIEVNHQLDNKTQINSQITSYYEEVFNFLFKDLKRLYVQSTFRQDKVYLILKRNFLRLLSYVILDDFFLSYKLNKNLIKDFLCFVSLNIISSIQITSQNKLNISQNLIPDNSIHLALKIINENTNTNLLNKNR
jgi:hypothetical protein